MGKARHDLASLVDRVETARDTMARTMVKSFGADPDLAQLVAADAIRVLLAPKRSQRLRVWCRRRVLVLALALGIPVLVTLLAVGAVRISRAMPPTYPRLYAVSDTWRPNPREGVFNVKPHIDSEGGVCFLSYTEDGADCLARALTGAVGQEIDEAVKQNKQGKIWEGPNGNGEHWAIERSGHLLTVTATQQQ